MRAKKTINRGFYHDKVELQTDHLDQEDLHNHDDGFSFSSDVNMKKVADRLGTKKDDDPSINEQREAFPILGSFDLKTNSQDGVTRATFANEQPGQKVNTDFSKRQEEGRKTGIHIGAPVVVPDLKLVDRDLKEMRKTFTPPPVNAKDPKPLEKPFVPPSSLPENGNSKLTSDENRKDFEKTKSQAGEAHPLETPPQPFENSAPSFLDHLSSLSEEGFLDVNLGIPREKMPQLSDQAKEELVQKYQADVTSGLVKAKELRGSQMEVSEAKVYGMVQFSKTIGSWSPCKAKIITANGPNGEIMVVDGHHRAMACFKLEGNMPIIHIDQPIQEVLTSANTLERTSHATLSEKKLSFTVHDPEKRRSLKEIEDLASSLAVTPQAIARREQRLFSLLEGFSRDEQFEILENYKQTQRKTHKRAAIVQLGGVTWAASKVFDGIGVTLRASVDLAKKGRELYCSLPGNQLGCQIQDVALGTLKTAGKKVIKKGAPIAADTINWSCNLHPLNRMQCDAIASGWEWTERRWSQLGSTQADQWERELGIPRDFTLDSVRGAKQIVELIAVNKAIGWISKAGRASTLDDWRKEFSSSLFADVNQKKKLPPPKTKPAKEKGAPQKSSPTKKKQKPNLHAESSVISEHSLRKFLNAREGGYRYSRELKPEDIGKVHHNPKGRVVVSRLTVRAEVNFPVKNSTVSLGIHSGINAIALEEKAPYIEVTSFFNSVQHARSIEKKLVAEFGGSVVASSPHKLSDGSTLEKVTFRAPVKKPKKTETNPSASVEKTSRVSKPIIDQPPFKREIDPDLISKIKQVATQLGKRGQTRHALFDLKVKSITALSPEYAAQNEIDAITIFAIEQLGFQKDSLIVRRSENILFKWDKGESDNVLYKISSPDYRNTYWVKSFPELEKYNGQFIREFASVQTLEQLNLQSDVRLAAIIAAGKFRQIVNDGKKTEPLRGFTATRHLPGKSGNTLLNEVSIEYAQGHQDLLKYLEHVASFLGHIHKQTKSVGEPSSGGYVKDQIYHFRRLVKKVSSFAELSVREQLEKLESKVVKPYLENPGDRGVVHGDANLRNFRTDPKGVSVFDTQSLSASRHEFTGKFIGTPVRDVEQLLVQLIVNGHKFGVSSEKIETYIKHFTDSYDTAFQGKHSPEAKRFFRIRYLLESMGREEGNKDLLKRLSEILLEELQVNPKVPLNLSIKQKVVETATKISKEEELVPSTIDTASVMNTHLIPDYGSAPQSLHTFVQDFFGNKGICLEKIPRKSLSHNENFFVKSVDGKSVAVLKEFHSSHSKTRGFLPDIVSVARLQERQLKHFTTPEILSVGQHTAKNGATRGLVLYEFVSGKTGLEVMANDLPARQLGRAIGELNAIGGGAKASKEYIQIISSTFESIAPFVIEHLRSAKISIRYKEGDIRKIVEDVKKNPENAGWVHGDFHLGNVLITPEGLSLIDTGSLMESMNRAGVAHGMPSIDRASMIVSIRANALKNGWSDAKAESLVAEFQEGYQEFMTLSDSSPSSRFSELYFEFFLLFNIVSKGSNTPLLKQVVKKLNANYERLMAP